MQAASTAAASVPEHTTASTGRRMTFRRRMDPTIGIGHESALPVACAIHARCPAGAWAARPEPGRYLISACEARSTATSRLEVTAGGQVRLGPGVPAQRLAHGLAGLLLTVRDAQADASWDRLRLCGNPDCRWAFYDRSHSRRGAWCDMASCGNRLKNRTLRARRAGAS